LAALTAMLVLTATGCTLSEEPESAGGDAVTLRFWSYYQGAQGEWLEQQTRDFEADNPGIKVDLIKTVGDQQDQRLLASVATGNGPDLFINNIVVDFPTLVSAGVMKDITGEWEGFAERKQFPESTAWRSDGKVYNLLPYTNLLGMYANTDILAEAGVTEMPSTIEELETAMAAVVAETDHEALAMSGAPTVEGAWLFAPQLLGQDISYCNFDDPAVDAAFQRLDGWAERGYLPKATATWDQNDAWQQFMTGKYAFALNGNWQLGNVKDAEFEYRTAQYPAPEGGRSVVFPGGEGIAIGADSKHPEQAWRYIEQVFLSADSAEAIFKTAGSIPVRADAAKTVQADELVQPFVTAAQNSARWPDNPKTADMQTALGKAVSGVISGQLDGAEGAAQAKKNIAAARSEGGGGCE
jgi:multiple sugar transport system substrate-binding protein